MLPNNSPQIYTVARFSKLTLKETLVIIKYNVHF